MTSKIRHKYLRNKESLRFFDEDIIRDPVEIKKGT